MTVYLSKFHDIFFNKWPKTSEEDLQGVQQVALQRRVKPNYYKLQIGVSSGLFQ